MQRNVDSANGAKVAEAEREAELRARAEATKKELRENIEQKMSLGGGSSAMDVEPDGYFSRALGGRGKGKGRARGLPGASSNSYRNK